MIRTKPAIAPIPFCSCLLLLSSGCMTGDLTSTDPLGDERSGGASLVAGADTDTRGVQLPDDDLLREDTLVRRAIFEGNQVGSEIFARVLNVTLGDLGLEAELELEPMTEDDDPSVRFAAQYVDAPDPDAQPSPETNTTDATEHHPETSITSCPYATPATADMTLVSCRFVVDRASDDAFIAMAQTLFERPLPTSFMEDAPDPELIRDWYERATEFSLHHLGVFAIDALRDAHLCDRNPTPSQSAFEEGVSVGRDLLAFKVLEQERITPTTRCDTDEAIVMPARDAAEGSIGDTVTANPLCPGFEPDSGDVAVLYTRAKDDYLAGVARGISDQAMLESARLVRDWECTPPRPEPTTTRGQGDPLVLDLDGNGIHFEPMRFGPTFDFGWSGEARTEWTASGDAFLVLDRNGDGAIDATELFGDVTLTEDGMLARDGFEALGLYDAAAQGGNGDDIIDAEDEIYGTLALWDDRDGDARVDEGELLSLEEASVSAIDIANRSFTSVDGSQGEVADLLFEYAAR